MSHNEKPEHGGDGDRETSLAATFVQLADTLVRDFDVTDLFDRLTTACVDLLDAAAAGLMLADQRGTLQLMASSSRAMRALELFELSHDEGPCLDAYARRSQISVDLRDPAARQSWPHFTTRAMGLGFTGVQALPMRLRDRTIGSLNVFHTSGERLDEHDTSLAQALSDVATIAILQRRRMDSSEELAAQLQTALNDRIVIEQVKGLLAERGHLGVDQAFAVLRDFCRSSRIPLTQTARELLTGRRDADEVLGRTVPSDPANPPEDAP